MRPCWGLVGWALRACLDGSGLFHPCGRLPPSYGVGFGLVVLRSCGFSQRQLPLAVRRPGGVVDACDLAAGVLSTLLWPSFPGPTSSSVHGSADILYRCSFSPDDLVATFLPASSARRCPDGYGVGGSNLHHFQFLAHLRCRLFSLSLRWFSLPIASPTTSNSTPCLAPDPLLVVWRRPMPSSDDKCSPNHLPKVVVPTGGLTSLSLIFHLAAMGLLRLMSGRNPCLACRCWQRRHSPVPLPWPLSEPLFEHHGKP